MGEKIIKRQIGIDFGTTTTSIAYCDNNEVAKLITIQGEVFVPTMIIESAEKDKERYGKDAEQYFQDYKNLQQNFKLDLTSNNSDVRKKAEELTHKFFVFLYKSYNVFMENQLKDKKTGLEKVEIIRTVVTYPGKFPDSVKKFLEDTARDVGFENVLMVSEAEAAMMYALKYDNDKSKSFFQAHLDQPLIVMMIDMGGGTTDISIFQYDVKTGSQDMNPFFYPDKDGFNFGGSMLDTKLYEYYEKCTSKDMKIMRTPLANNERSKRLILVSLKSYKECTISPCLKKDEEVCAPPVLMTIIPEGGGILRRQNFEEEFKDYLSEFPKLINGALNGAVAAQKIKDRDIDLILLVGGHSQWYFVNDMLMDKELINLPKIQNGSDQIIGFVSADNEKSSIPLVAIGAAYHVKGYVPPLCQELFNKYESNYNKYRFCSDCFLNIGNRKTAIECSSNCECNEVCTEFDEKNCDHDTKHCHNYTCSCDNNCYDCNDCDDCLLWCYDIV